MVSVIRDLHRMVTYAIDMKWSLSDTYSTSERERSDNNISPFNTNDKGTVLSNLTITACGTCGTMSQSSSQLQYQ